VLHVQLARPAKRNAINDALVAELQAVFGGIDSEVRAIVVSGEGEAFCAGLDLSELGERSTADGIGHSRAWHAAFDRIEKGRVPVVAVLHGAVVGGGLELASACHVRVAEPSAFFALPEGSRGLFVGGGGAARIPKLIGVARMADMMLTGRVYRGAEAHAAGFAQLSNFAVVHALPRIAEMGQDHALFTEALMAAIAQGDDAAKERMRAFLDKKAGKVGQPS
jgi:enoyl-CoA hydratase/carnithine racemase